MINKIFRRKKGLGFIHVPKTGGTYLIQRESDCRPVIEPLRYFGHCCVVTKIPSRIYPPMGYRPNYVIAKSEVERYFIFSTVRNPFSFLVSYYHHAGGHSPKYNDKQHYDYLLCQNSFDYFVKTVAERYEPWPSRKFIHAQIFCDDGSMIVDWINRQETLDNDLSKMAIHVNASYEQKLSQRVVVKDDYRKYYSDELIDIVNETWRREMHIFGYDFNGPVADGNYYYLYIPKKQKNLINYFWDTDQLMMRT